MFQTLITVAGLAELIGKPELVLIDCRFELARPGWGAEAYAGGHLPGARYAHLDEDLSGPVSGTTGRHPLPAPAELAERLARWGIGPHTQVVTYDQGPGAYAARLWWMLGWLGHSRAAVLDGGLTEWQKAQLPIECGIPAAARPPPQRLLARPDPRRVVGAGEIERAVASGALERGEQVLIDARGAERFAGRNETLDPVAGHVPGARNHPFTDNLDSGRFLSADRLRERFAHTLAGQRAANAICMCGSGVTACHDLLAMQVAGLSGAKLYAGSWSEWIRDPSRPVARGA